MNAKHTPGPWRIAPPGVYTSGVNIDAFSGGYVALIGGGISDPVMADARLIAAAPDLLEALVDLRWHTQNIDLDDEESVKACEESMGKARRAIAKARGEA